MKKTLTVLLCYLISAVMLPACNGTNEKQSQESKNKIVAIVNYDKINLSDLLDEINQFRSKYGISFENNKERYQTIARLLLDELILIRIYHQEAARLKITADESEVEAYLSYVISDYTREDMSRMFESRNIDALKWKAKIKDDRLFKKLIAQEVKDKIKVEESEIKDYYKAHSKDYMLPARVQALQIVVNNELEAEAIYNELLEGANFSRLAKSKSVSPEGENGGDLGFFSRGQMPKEFDDAVFNLKVGKFSKVVYTPFGYHIFKVVKKKKEKIMNYKDAREKIREKLTKEREKIEFTNWIIKLKEKSIIVIKETVLSNIWQKI